MNLKQHIHRMRIQLFCLNCIKEDLKSTVLLHVDFSESYKNANQDEIQSTYFRQSWFLIFTACAYTCTNMENRTISITVTTESNEHSRVTALSCIHKIISYMRKRLELLRNCAYGLRCASQFRSRFVFLFLSHFHLEKEIEWHFNEANHGKEPMDSVGATIKNKVFRELKSGRLTITFPNNINLTSPEELSNAAEGLFLKTISI